MKALLIFCFIVSIVFFLSGCSTQNLNQTDLSTQEPEVEVLVEEEQSEEQLFEEVLFDEDDDIELGELI